MVKKRLYPGLSFWLVLVFLLVHQSVGFSQQLAVNPFDLMPRLASASDSTLLSVSSNPFDILLSSPVVPSSGFTPGFTVERSKDVPTAQQLANIYQRFKFAAVLVMLVWMALIFIIFRVLLGKIWESFWNENMLNQLLRDRTPGSNVAYLIMYAFYFYNVGLFAFLAFKQYGNTIHRQHIIGLSICVGMVMALYGLKHLEWWILRNFLPARRELTTISFTTMVLSIITGLMLVPVVMFVAYTPPPLATYAVYTGMGLILLVGLYLAFRGLLLGAPYLLNSTIHFFLYLCAAEIGPILLLFKAIFHHWVGPT